LWLNQWADGSGDALELGDIDAALNLERPSVPERGWLYVAGVDVGLVHDASCIAVVGRHVGYSEPVISCRAKPVGVMAAMQELDLAPSVAADIVDYRRIPGTERLKLCRLEVWQPDGGKVDLQQVENKISELHREFNLSRVTADPWQAELMLQRLSRAGVPTEGLQMSGTTLQALATAMLTEFRGRTIDLLTDPLLSADLKNLRIASRSYGFRLESPTNAVGGTGHGDTVSALALAIRGARQISVGAMFDPTRRLVYN
jgi:phage terminase large subunit-like protein